MTQLAARNSSISIYEVAYLGLSLLGSWLLVRWTVKQLDPTKKNVETAKQKKKALSKRLGRVVNLDGQYEDVIAQEVVNPESISVSLADIGGLDHIIDDLQRNVITPMRRPELFCTSLLRQKRGVLLYGPPGTGKTMLAKALARECGACFVNLKASTLLSKWYGDTNKLIAAVWTLAYKIQPAILFIDEVDALLGARRSQEHEATTAMKTEFMQLWDGFETSTDSNILVLGATNKRDDLDDAVLRRFSLQYEVRLPPRAQREAILRLVLGRHARELGPGYLEPGLMEDIYQVAAGAEERGLWHDAREDAEGARSGGSSSPATQGENETKQPPRASTETKQLPRAPTSAPATRPFLPPRPSKLQSGTLDFVAQQTEGYSGSDLTELCSQAAAIPFHDAAARGAAPEPLGRRHFEQALAMYNPPSRAAREAAAREGGAGKEESVRLLAALMSRLVEGAGQERE